MAQTPSHCAIIAAVAVLLFPLALSAEVVTCTNSYAGSQSKTYTLPAGTLNPGPDQQNSLQTNAAAAQANIGKTFFTTELTSFNDKNCTGGPCRNNVPGIAHRTWPINSCVAVCNLKNKKCAVAIVMDRGPNTKLGCRTIDANPALQTALDMKGGTVPATFKLLSLPPKVCEQIKTDPNMNVDMPRVTASAPPQGLPGVSPFTMAAPTPVGYPAGIPSPFANLTPAPNNYFNSSAGQVFPYNTYCITSTEPLVVQPVPAGTPFPSNCYNTPQQQQVPPRPVQPAPQSTPPPSSASSLQPNQPSQPSLAQQLLQQLQAGPGAQTTFVNPVATLVVQPASVMRGNTIVVSWSSVGMKSDVLCRVFQSGTQIAQGNQGSKIVPTTSTTPRGAMQFSLSCAAQNGAIVEKKSTATIN